MKKVLVIFLIFSLILFTSIIKNSTKKIDEDIFVINENLRDLSKEFENIKLENDFLSSAEKLLEYKIQYFDDELIQKKIHDVKIISINSNHLQIKKFNIIKNNEK